MDNSSWRCSVCGFELYHPIGRLRFTSVGLYDDDRYPGRSIVVLREHREHLDSLEPNELAAFMGDVQQVSRALRAVTGASRINFAVLGNTVAHLHAHLIPRVRGGDPVPNSSPWDHPQSAGALEPDTRIALVERIREQLRA